jgi:hypothetical protein
MIYNDINPCSPLGKGQKKAIKRRSEECLPGDQQSLSRLKAGSLVIPRRNSGFLNRSVATDDCTQICKEGTCLWSLSQLYQAPTGQQS